MALVRVLEEQGDLPPLFFDTLERLKKWADEQGYFVEPLREHLKSCHSNNLQQCPREKNDNWPKSNQACPLEKPEDCLRKIPPSYPLKSDSCQERRQPCDLEKWAYCRGMRIGDFPDNTKDIARVRSKTCSYDQLWVRASWKPYRAPFRSWHRLRDGIPPGLDLKTLNADHVVSKEVLRALKKPSAWVMLFPVEGQANQGFGSRVEKRIAVRAQQMQVAEIQLLSIFKVFSAKMPKTPEDLDFALDDVRKQFLAPPPVDFAKMRGLLAPLMSQKLQAGSADDLR